MANTQAIIDIDCSSRLKYRLNQLSDDMPNTPL